ncbi:MAG: hypothetical protein ACK5LJ_18150 [Paracoccus sp. (in: a-proteobacteria)]
MSYDPNWSEYEGPPIDELTEEDGDRLDEDPSTRPAQKHRKPLLIWGGIGIAALLGYLAASRMGRSSQPEPRPPSPPPYRQPPRRPPPPRRAGRRDQPMKSAIEGTGRVISSIGMLLAVANTAADLLEQISQERSRMAEAKDADQTTASPDDSPPSPGEERMHRL